jgi:hypothetical protein
MGTARRAGIAGQCISNPPSWPLTPCGRLPLRLTMEGFWSHFLYLSPFNRLASDPAPGLGGSAGDAAERRGARARDKDDDDDDDDMLSRW